MNNTLRRIVREGNIEVAKRAYKQLILPVYRWTGVPVYDITASWKHRYTWFRIPKNGTHSIMQMLVSRSTPDINSSYVPYVARRHQDQTRFCVIRNPWDRLVSVYCNKVLMRLMYPECWERDFGYFIEFVSRQDLGTCDSHIRLQTAMFPVNDIDHMARMECFESDMAKIMSAIFEQSIEVPKIGAIKHENYREYYSEALKSQVEQLYKADVEFGGYQF